MLNRVLYRAAEYAIAVAIAPAVITLAILASALEFYLEADTP